MDVNNYPKKVWEIILANVKKLFTTRSSELNFDRVKLIAFSSGQMLTAIGASEANCHLFMDEHNSRFLLPDMIPRSVLLIEEHFDIFWNKEHLWIDELFK